MLTELKDRSDYLDEREKNLDEREIAISQLEIDNGIEEDLTDMI